LVNTPWYWHGVLNLGDDDPDELIVGVPTRFYVDRSVPAFKSDAILSSVSLLTMWINYGGIYAFTQNGNNLQNEIMAARSTRTEEFNADQIGAD
jgi:hypothetical protein